MTTELAQARREARVRTTGRLIEQVYSRAAGAPLVEGNSVRLLRDAAENYPAWLAAIRRAERTIHFESFIIHEDEVGREFAAELAARARAGVRVRLIYDWLGALGKTSARFWNALRAAGVEVRCVNPPRFDEPFGWLSRDHRKMLSVDGRIAFVTGLCVGRDWVGDPARGVEPWRDTGVEVRGPAVAHVEQAFTQVWAETGAPPLPAEDVPPAETLAPAGEMSVRVVATEPHTTGLYRLDIVIAASARRRLWLTDAYFVGTTTYVQALRAAAADGVDVRLLVPGASDIAVVRALSHANYRPLLEGGIRVFEWNGPMIHAKTAVADGRWARVGSTNLNVASWIGNWELDLAVEDEEFARRMEEMYLSDLEHSTEIVLSAHKRVRSTSQPERHTRRKLRRQRKASATRAAAGAIGIGNAVGAAITDHRVLGPAEARVMLAGSLLLLALSVVAVVWPRVLAFPLAFIGLWVAVALLIKAYKLHARGESAQPSRSSEA